MQALTGSFLLYLCMSHCSGLGISLYFCFNSGLQKYSLPIYKHSPQTWQAEPLVYFAENIFATPAASVVLGSFIYY